MIPRLAFLLLAIFLAPTAAVIGGLPALKVANDHRHIVTTDGKPFFYLADTAWELFHRLNREDAEAYLKKRAQQGFNVIHAVVLAEYDLSIPNAYGELALEDFDPLRPREAYFAHVDFIVNKAESLGLYVGMLPTWGDKWNKKWGKGPEIFNPQNAERYGEWLARRYKDKPIVWILGGDRPVETDAHRKIIRAMAGGLQRGDSGRGLISYHPSGGSNSSQYWPDEPWLDFHMFQSGHAAKAIHNFEFNSRNLTLKSLKPTLDGEPCYEDHPVRGLWREGSQDKPKLWFDDYDVRRAAWWSVLSGACGHVYGNHNIWQMLSDKREPVFFARTPWTKAIDHPGALQMGVMRRLVEQWDWQKLRPDRQFVLNSDGWQMAAVSVDKDFAIVYSPTLNGIAPDLSSMQAGETEFEAYDPRTGEKITGLSFQDGVVLAAPAQPCRDWVLAIRKK